jgi:hypothetical protein
LLGAEFGGVELAAGAVFDWVLFCAIISGAEPVVHTSKLAIARPAGAHFTRRIFLIATPQPLGAFPWAHHARLIRHTMPAFDTRSSGKYHRINNTPSFVCWRIATL